MLAGCMIIPEVVQVFGIQYTGTASDGGVTFWKQKFSQTISKKDEQDFVIS